MTRTTATAPIAPVSLDTDQGDEKDGRGEVERLARSSHDPVAARDQGSGRELAARAHFPAYFLGLWTTTLPPASSVVGTVL